MQRSTKRNVADRTRASNAPSNPILRTKQCSLIESRIDVRIERRKHLDRCVRACLRKNAVLPFRFRTKDFEEEQEGFHPPPFFLRIERRNHLRRASARSEVISSAKEHVRFVVSRILHLSISLSIHRWHMNRSGCFPFDTTFRTVRNPFLFQEKEGFPL